MYGPLEVCSLKEVLVKLFCLFLFSLLFPGFDQAVDVGYVCVEGVSGGRGELLYFTEYVLFSMCELVCMREGE